MLKYSPKQVNGAADSRQELEFPPTGAWDSWGTVTSGVISDFVPGGGTNTIVLEAVPGVAGPNVDRFQITQDVAESVQMQIVQIVQEQIQPLWQDALVFQVHTFLSGIWV